jgi:outer membrane usher protein
MLLHRLLTLRFHNKRLTNMRNRALLFHSHDSFNGHLREISFAVSALFGMAGVALAQASVDAPLQMVAVSPNMTSPNATMSMSEATLTTRKEKVLPLDVVINGHKAGSWMLIEYEDLVYAPQEAYDEWRVTYRGNAVHRKFLEQDYIPLAAVPGYESNIDFTSQTINIIFDSASFSATSLVKERDAVPVVDKVIPSGFINYDISYSATSPRAAPNVKELGLLTEVGVSNEWGVLTSKFTGRNLTNETALGTKRHLIRLDTTFTKHFPSQNLALQLGDSSIRPGLWGNNVYFGGARIGTDYGLTPGFISQPLPILSGLSSAPSTVEMYVNDVLRQTSNVPAGPFTMDSFPQLSGGGVARLVVRDALGRETVITQDFFTSNRLLTPGLSDWSAELGRIRRNFGNENSNYDDAFASGFWRRGFSDKLTGEGRVEISKDIKAIGAGALYALPGNHLAKTVLVASNSAVGSGSQWLLGVERQEKEFSYAIQAQGATEKFRQLGQELNTSATKLQLAGNASYNISSMGSFGAGIATITKYDQARITTLSMNYATDVGKQAKLSVNVSRAFASATSNASNAIGVSFVMPLQTESGYTTLLAAANHRDNSSDFYVSASHASSDGNGLGWHTLAGFQSSQARAEGGLTYEGRYGNVNGDLSASRDLTALRLGAKGGMVVTDGNFFATRVVDGSYGIAEVPGYANIGIGLGGNSMTKTDARGIALIPRMSPYQHNGVRIDPSELPISAEIDSIEQVAVPAYRSAVKVVFPVRSGRGALIKINFEDGQTAPVGAPVYLDGDKQEFYVSRNGAAFVTGLESKNILKLVWKGKSCTLQVTLPPVNEDDIARVGPVICQGVNR